MFRWTAAIPGSLGLALALLAHPIPAGADLGVGDAAILYTSVNEDMEPVDMADMIDGRPLVLLTGSVS
ncbi:MAG: hypothetical protein JRG91_10340 [Deltaproteobacteria bacterium]|nr:hypothetical protein [Deltaproteobacteria bacterium]